MTPESIAANSHKPYLKLGHVVATPGAIAALTKARVDPLTLLHRHACGDWGDLTEDDVLENLTAVLRGDLRVLSSYKVTPEVTVWIITEADRSSTTVLLPDEY